MLNAIIARSTLLAEKPTIDLVKFEFERRMEVEKARITSEKIIEVTARYFEIDEDELKSTKRNKEILLPRQVAMYIMKEKTDITVTSIGKIFDKDHSTVLNAIGKIRKKVEIDEDGIKSEISDNEDIYISDINSCIKNIYSCLDTKKIKFNELKMIDSRYHDDD